MPRPSAVRGLGHAVLLLSAFGLIAVKVLAWGYAPADVDLWDGYEGTVTVEAEAPRGAFWIEAAVPDSSARQRVPFVRGEAGRLRQRRVETPDGRRFRWSDEAGGRAVVRYRFRALVRPARYRVAEGPEAAALRDAFDDARGHADGAARLVAWAEGRGTPARLVSGLLPRLGGVAEPHVWAELSLGGAWVPFDPARGHFAELPATHLAVSGGGGPLVRASPGTDLRVDVVARPLTAAAGLSEAFSGRDLPLNPFGLWDRLEALGLDVELVLFLLLFPVASTVVVFSRNVVGVQTYGVFLPGLVAVGGLSMGLPFTLVSFVLVTTVVGLLNFPLERWGVLYTPKMALMLLGVVGAVLAAAWLGVRTGWYAVSGLSVLPLVILSLTAERFAKHLGEDGPGKAGRVLLSTVGLITVCYGAVAVEAVQYAVLAFPEVLLALASANLALGRWMGVRVSEFKRFRWLAGRAREQGRAFYDEVVGINRRNVGVIHPANPRRYFFVANDKVVTKALLEEYAIPTPKTLAVFAEVGGVEARFDEIAHLDDFVIKPAKGAAGNAIYVLGRAPDGDGWQTPGGTRYAADDLKRILADIVFGTQSSGIWDRAIVEERVFPHPFFARLYADGLPDVRVITHYGEPVLAMARVPTDASDGKANLHQGALGVGIDLQTGRMGKGYDYEGYLERHPDTGVPFESLVVPYWDRIVRICREIAALVPLGYLGVDVVLDRDRGPVVMEINARPGIEIQNVSLQGLRPLAEATDRREAALGLDRVLSWDQPDRRGGSRRKVERRHGERRHGERRVADLPFHGPDRRRGERRQGERRQGERRQGARRGLDPLIEPSPLPADLAGPNGTSDQPRPGLEAQPPPPPADDGDTPREAEWSDEAALGEALDAVPSGAPRDPSAL